MPNRSFAPCTTSTGTVTASSSPIRLAAGAAPERRGGWSGKARQSTAAAPVAAAVRQATRAPDDRPPATSERPSQVARGEVLDHRGPRGVELMRRRRRTSARDAIGLFDEHGAEPCRVGGSRGGDEVPRADSASCAVTEDERSPRRVVRLQVRSRRAERRFDFGRVLDFGRGLDLGRRHRSGRSPSR